MPSLTSRMAQRLASAIPEAPAAPISAPAIMIAQGVLMVIFITHIVLSTGLLIG